MTVETPKHKDEGAVDCLEGNNNNRSVCGNWSDGSFSRMCRVAKCACGNMGISQNGAGYEGN